MDCLRGITEKLKEKFKSENEEPPSPRDEQDDKTQDVAQGTLKRNKSCDNLKKMFGSDAEE